MSQPTFSAASILADTIVRTVELGVTITDAAVDGETTVVWCTLLATDGRGRCPGCGTAGVYRDSVERRLTDLPVAGHPLQLRVRVPRYRCPQAGCERVIFYPTPPGWRGRERRPRGGAPGSCCAGWSSTAPRWPQSPASWAAPGTPSTRSRARPPPTCSPPSAPTRTALLTTGQKTRLAAVFADDAHAPVEVTWLVYQQIITAYAHPDPREGKTLPLR